MSDDPLVFGRPLIEEPEIEEVVACLRSGWIGNGPRVERFERMLEAAVGAPHVRCVSSCSAALMIGMRALGIGPGDEVLVPSMTFVASANAVIAAGADVRLVDCDPRTGLVDLAAAEAMITPRTRALLVVHLAGQPVDLEAVGALRDRHGLLVVEDAAHALGARWRDRSIGCHGNLTAFSFYVTKNITTGEGGAIATDDAAVAERVERLALHGLSGGAWSRHRDGGYVHYEVDEEVGFKHTMTDLQAAIGIHQLPRLDRWIARRRELARRYDELLRDAPVVTPPSSAGHAHHLYRVEVERRDDVLDRLHADGVGAGLHYRGVHLHPYYARRYGLEPGDLPATSAMSDRTLSLPLDPALTEAEQQRVVAALLRAVA
jgi:dTDP-4-amino-4,6-dideoxygalactose transaminase